MKANQVLHTTFHRGNVLVFGFISQLMLCVFVFTPEFRIGALEEDICLTAYFLFALLFMISDLVAIFDSQRVKEAL